MIKKIKELIELLILAFTEYRETNKYIKQCFEENNKLTRLNISWNNYLIKEKKLYSEIQLKHLSEKIRDEKEELDFQFLTKLLKDDI